MFLKLSAQQHGILTNMANSLISFTEHFMDGTLRYSQFEKIKFQVGVSGMQNVLHSQMALTYTLFSKLQLNIKSTSKVPSLLQDIVWHLSVEINDNNFINVHIKMSCSLGDNIKGLVLKT
jgi:hypothetical protein